MRWLLFLTVYLVEYVPICKAINCDNVRFYNGEVITTSRPPYKPGTELKFKCDAGYKGIGRETIRCLANGHWSDPVPYCHAFVCSKDLSAIEKGRNCRKSCSTHFNCRGTFKRCLCDDACGKSCFNPNAECPKPIAPDNGYVVQNELSYGHTIFYGCDEGYSLSGPQTRRCRSDRKWSGYKPRCVEYGVCGQAGDVQTNAKYKVIEGTNAKEGAWPWQTLLFEHKKPFNNKAGFAGGTIISNKWILTAAHIHTEFPLMLKNKAWKETFMMAVGFLRYPGPGEQVSPNADFFEPENFIIHSKFDAISMDYDIALIPVGNHMKREGFKFVVDKTRTLGIIQFTQYIRPGCLPCMKDYVSPVGDLVKNFNENQCAALKNQKDAEAGTEVIVTGFGLKRDPGGPNMPTYRPNSLQQGLLSVWTEKRCIEANQKIKQIDDDSRFTDRMLCARSADETKFVDSCQGDSGGPIVKVVGNEEENRWIQIGIVSWGKGCGNQFPGFYTSVIPLMSWIMEKIKQKVPPLCKSPKIFVECASMCPPTCAKPELTSCRRGCDENVFCVCPNGMVQQDKVNRTCVKLEECSVPSQCKSPKIFVECASMCPPTCAEPEPTICTRQCDVNVFCICPNGMVQQDKVNRTCVKLEECSVPSLCKSPKIFVECASMCPPTCAEPEPIFCTRQCDENVFCVCPNGMVQQDKVNRTCVKLEECSDCSWTEWIGQDCFFVPGKGFRITQVRKRKINGGRGCIGPSTRELECQPPVVSSVAGGGGLDLLFLLDESDNVGETNFKKSVDFAVSLTSKLCGKIDIGHSKTRIALASFYDSLNVKIDFHDFSQKTPLLEKMRLTRYLPSRGSRKKSCLPVVLKTTLSQIFVPITRSRPSKSTEKLIILVTSGCSDCEESKAKTNQRFTEVAESLRKEGISILTFVVGDFEQCASSIMALLDGSYCYQLFASQNWKEFERQSQNLESGPCMRGWSIGNC